MARDKIMSDAEAHHEGNLIHERNAALHVPASFFSKPRRPKVSFILWIPCLCSSFDFVIEIWIFVRFAGNPKLDVTMVFFCLIDG